MDGSENTVKQGLSVGDILSSSWGYDQTNVNFYEVVRATTKTVWLRERGKAISSGNGLSPMAGYATLADGFVSDKLIQCRPSQSGYCRVHSSAVASLWDGKPEYVSWYA